MGTKDLQPRHEPPAAPDAIVRHSFTPPAESDLSYAAPPSDQVQLEKCIVGWLDLLGFTQRTRAAARQGEVAELQLVREYHQVMRPALEALQYAFEDTDFRWRTLTDNVVLSVPLLALHPEVTIGHIVMEAAQMQFRLARQGWFLRGGITIGPLYVDDRIIVGSGLLDAYEMETAAVHSRLIAGPELVAHTLHHLTFYGDPFDSPVNQIFAVDANADVFVNYLYAPAYLDYPLDATLRMLMEHRQQVELALQVTANSRRVNRKFRWSAAYHNWFCRTYIPYRDRKPLIIPGVRSRFFSRIVSSPDYNDEFRARFGRPFT